jgi:hypothetical protein
MGLKVIEIDWYLDPLRDVISGVEHGLKQVSARPDEVEWFDGNFVMDHSEWLLGVAFVAAQAYVERAVGDICRHLMASGGAPGENRKTLRTKCLARDVRLDPLPMTRVELINAAANYYKHHDGPQDLWPDTAQTLRKAGINLEDPYAYPCAHAASLLCGNEWNLHMLCDIVKDWRAQLVRSTLSSRPG